ncbi:uncharacterized protein si:ch211-1a19.3 isoform X2 [Ictalurus furcatus]|uniref:uncharacterized protein si:ch211-1a19.3 isoform X2 n=1 Tax=Ictalurus furcatus TaxID=66913 RepID=UPI002350FCF8|nr:uncharacterized protein si:ch211-1a19.3 isoform X2 [Ictalurus furcatus]
MVHDMCFEEEKSHCSSHTAAQKLRRKTCERAKRKSPRVRATSRERKWKCMWDMLNDNITRLKDEIELHKAIEANLTANITQQQDTIELLQHNLTQTAFELGMCTDLRKAALNLQTAAEKQTQGCQSSKQFLQKQLEKCKSLPQTSSQNDGPPGPRSGAVLVGLLCISFLLVP